MSEIKIRNATVEDATELLKIYSYYVEKTAISFEIETPTLKEFEDRIVKIKKNFTKKSYTDILNSYTY